MPRLIEHISVGFCAGYGDGDFRVSMSVRNLSRKGFDELKLAMLSALRCAEDHWLAAQTEKPENQGFMSSGPVLADATHKEPSP